MATPQETIKGIERANQILVDWLGKKKAAKVLRLVRYYNGKTIPAYVAAVMPKQGWVGCVIPNVEGGNYTIVVNPDQNFSAADVAYTVGHELAHVLQMINGVKVNHKGEIFNLFREAYAAQLGFKKGTF